MPFISGLELSRLLYEEAVRPILARHLPDLRYAAALVGPGSDVLGFDTEMSTDHGWGPRLFVLLGEAEAHLNEAVREVLRRSLPATFRGYPVGAVLPIGEGGYEPKVAVGTPRRLVRELLAYDVDRPPDVADWLTFPSQTLRELTAGAVYHDGVGELTALRERLAWYPRDVWLYLLAAGWARIGQEGHLMPRAGYVGDELGSALIGSRLVRDVMSLLFLMERQYAPYPKWFGSAFRRLSGAGELEPILWRAQRAADWRAREAALVAAYEFLARRHNGLGLTEPVRETVAGFHDRPFRVIDSDGIAAALVARIDDPRVRRVAERPLIGGIDQFSDSTDLRSGPRWREALRGLYS